MVSWLRVSSWLCAAMSLALLGAGGYLKWSRAVDPAAGLLVVSPREIDLGEIAPRSPVPVEFVISNHSRQPVRLLGTDANRCTAGGCINTPFQPGVLAPGQSLKVPMTFHPGSDLDFAVVPEFYTDRPGQPKLRLKIHGRLANASDS